MQVADIEGNDPYIDALDFAKDVAEKMSRISPDEYFLRKDRSIKTKDLIDEAWPLATYGKILYHPHRKVEIAYSSRKEIRDKKTDAMIRISGSQKDLEGWDNEIPIEITSVYPKDAHLVREEMAKTGFSWGAKNITRKKNRNVVSVCGCSDVGEEDTPFLSNILCNLSRKYQMKYPENCIILCALFPENTPEWASNWEKNIKTLINKIDFEIRYKTVFIESFRCQYHFLSNSMPQRGYVP